MAPMDGTGDGIGDRAGSAWALDDLLAREWLAVNHIGGFASSTLAGLNTRKYHALLVAAMSPPVRRLVLLSRVEETVTCEGWPAALSCNEYPGTIHPQGHQSLRAFSADPFPRWAYQGAGWAIEKSLQLLRGRNAVLLSYTLLGGSGPVQLDLRPLLALRPIHELMYQWNGRLEAAEVSPGHHRVPATNRSPEVFFAHDGQFDPAGAAWYFNTIYRHEMARGYAGLEDLWSPGAARWTLEPGQSAHFVCSDEPIELSAAISQAAMQSSAAAAGAPFVSLPARDPDHDLLVRAVEPFVLDRAPDGPAASRSAPGMITRFPWACPGVRDALIAMPGVLLVTGHFARARSMLLDLAGELRDGMIPTEFPEDAGPPTFEGADTSLWFVNAAWHYLRYSQDEPAIARLLEPIAQIIAAYRSSSANDVGIDSEGLIFTRRAGATWMNARAADGGFVTPRIGRAIELNALWYNAVRVGAELSEMMGQSSQAHQLNEFAFAIADAFNERFWNSEKRCCYDVIADSGGDRTHDGSIRPNQLLAANLPFAVLRADRQAIMLETIRTHLLTSYGLRTLSPADPSYRGHYGGDAASRDAALHQGTVHPWLLGAYVTASVRVQGRGESSRRAARERLEPILAHIRDSGMGQVRELFDGDPPHYARGAIAVAPAAGELLRCYVEEILDLRPGQLSPARKTAQLRPVIAAPVPSIEH